MAATISFRPDDDARLALNELTADGTPVSRVVRDALIAAAERHAKARLRAEAGALAADEHDRAEAAEVLRDMESLRAW
ncbi:hypothetical protein [Demetria terragena]|uniref:hypothetical protein n=1 Tax=Demetria terragena TaxID=63959 RepID=UPI000362F935|nr:hypothetical protein [Demetria terragena]